MRAVTHDEISEAPKRLFGGIGVNGSKRSRVASVEGIEQSSSLDPTDLTKDDSVRPPAKSRFQKVIEGDAGLQGIGLAFDGENVWFLDVNLRSILDDDNAIFLGNEIGQNSQ